MNVRHKVKNESQTSCTRKENSPRQNYSRLFFFSPGGTTVDIVINENGWAHIIALHRANLYGINCEKRNTSN